MHQVEFPNGKLYAVAPLGLTEEACDLLEMQEQLGEDGFSMARFVRVIRTCISQAMDAAGNTPDEIREALGCVPLSLTDKSEIIKRLLAVMVSGSPAE